MTALAFALVLSPPPWTVNDNRTLVWSGEPYLPVGVRVEGSLAAIEAAATAGIRDVVVELPANGRGWREVIDGLESRGMRYAVAVSSAAPTSPGVIVEPEAYRVPGIEAPTRVRLRLEGASEALLVLSKVSDGTVRWSRRAVVSDGILETEVDPLVHVPHVLLVYPVVDDLRTADFGERFDSHRDVLLRTLAANPLGPNARALIGATGEGAHAANADANAIPLSTVFRLESSDFLERKYGVLATAVKAWGITTHDIETFDHLGRLVPLWTPTRGVPNLWDPIRDRLYPVEYRSSAAWADLRACKADLAARRSARLVEAVYRATGLPLVQTAAGRRTGIDRGIHGVGCRPEGLNPSEWVEDAGRAMSLALRRADPSFVWALDFPVAGIDPATVVRELEAIGVRGWFFRADSEAELRAVAAAASARAGDRSPAEWTIRPLFYPETARDPALTMPLPGGAWWLPAPWKGERLDLGAGFEGYRMEAPEGPAAVLWSTAGPRRVRLLTSDAAMLQARDPDGRAIELRRRRGSVEVELSETPLLFTGSEEAPVPDAALTETLRTLTALFDTQENRVDPTGSEKFAFLDSVQASKTRPERAFRALRAQLAKVAPRVAPYSWLAGARPRETNFGSPVPGEGSAFPQVLRLATRFALLDGPCFAEYEATVRADGEYAVWVAARLPTAARGRWLVRLGDQALAPAPPTSLYGAGFAWYRFGTVGLAKGGAPLRVEVPADPGLDAEIDVVAILPVGIQPAGPRQPFSLLAGVSSPAKPR